MKKALISTIEPRSYFDGSTGFRVAQVEEIGFEFPVADSLYWIDCDDNVVADFFYFDSNTQTIKAVPEQPLVNIATKPQPTTTGTTIL